MSFLGKTKEQTVGFVATFKSFFARKPVKILSIIFAIIIVGGLAVLIISNKKTTFTDSSGTEWQKFKESKTDTNFKVFMEQSNSEHLGYINKECDPSTPLASMSKLEYKDLNYRNGIDRPNHCLVVAGYYKGLSSDSLPVNTFVLLPDGSLITLDGSQTSAIQVNISEQGTRIIQSQGKAFYRIAKQPAGKKFVIQAGSQEFTAVGTKVFADIDNGEKVNLGLYEGSGTLTERRKNGGVIEMQVGKFAEYSYKIVEKLAVDKLVVMGVSNLLAKDGFFATQLTNDKTNNIDKIRTMNFSEISAFMPEVVNIEEDRLMRQLEADIEANNKKWAEDSAKLNEQIDASNEALRQKILDSNAKSSNSSSSSSSGSSPSSSSGSTSNGSGSQCFSKSSQPLSYGVCVKNGGAVNAGKCCL